MVRYMLFRGLRKIFKELPFMEIRRNKQFGSRLFVKLKSGSVVYWGALRNVSAYGLFIRSNRNLDIDAVLTVEVFMPGNTVSLLKGIVKRIEELPGRDRKFGIEVRIIERDETYEHFLKMVGVQERKPSQLSSQPSQPTVC
jgi:hypothetical protein